MKVERIVNSFLQSNTFILSHSGENDLYIIDIGDISPLLKSIGERNVKGLFLTHAHFDHIYGINDLLVAFPDCIVYASQPTFNALKNDKLNFSYYYEKPLLYKGATEIVLSEGQLIPLWNDLNLQTYITPGHSLGSTCFKVDNNLFTGDAYIPNVPPVTKLKEGNKAEALKSIERIKSLIYEGDVVHPGHLTQYLMKNDRLQ